jgi:hypothetical protein
VTVAEAGCTVPRQFSFTTRPYAAVDDATGASIGLDTVDRRVRWLLYLISCAESELVFRLWQPATFDALAAGRDSSSRPLPVQGQVAAARLGWHPTYPTDVYVPSRVTLVVTSQAIGTLRTLAYRDTAMDRCRPGSTPSPAESRRRPRPVSTCRPVSPAAWYAS